MLTLEINAEDSLGKINSLGAVLENAQGMYGEIAGMLESETEANFAAQGRPDWAPMAAATKRERLKRNNGGSVLKLLQDRGILAASVSTEYGADHAIIGAGGAAKDYAAAQQFGATINRAAYSVKTRLRTDRKGNLLRQGEDGKKKNLAVFAKDTHKQVEEKWSEVGAFSINLPARPYLPFSGGPDNAKLQPGAEEKLLDILSRYVLNGLG